MVMADFANLDVNAHERANAMNNDRQTRQQLAEDIVAWADSWMQDEEGIAFSDKLKHFATRRVACCLNEQDVATAVKSGRIQIASRMVANEIAGEIVLCENPVLRWTDAYHARLLEYIAHELESTSYYE